MKRCPKCNSTFTDDSLYYCVSDGTSLVSVSNDPSQETLVIPDPSRIKIVKVERKNGDVLEFSESFATATEEKLIIHDASGKKIAEFYRNNIGDWWTESDNKREEQKKEKQGHNVGRGGYGAGGGRNDREPRW
jgi:hypothetical protein